MMESVRPYEQAVSGLAPSLRGRLLTLPHSVVAQAQELRLLLGQPPILRACNRSQCYRNLAPVTAQELSQSLLTLSGQALHTHQMEIAQGFLTLPGDTGRDLRPLRSTMQREERLTCGRSTRLSCVSQGLFPERLIR